MCVGGGGGERDWCKVGVLLISMGMIMNSVGIAIIRMA